MPSGGTGTVTSAVLRISYAELCSIITHRDLYHGSTIHYYVRSTTATMTSPTFPRYKAKKESQRKPSNLQRSTMKSSEPDSDMI